MKNELKSKYKNDFKKVTSIVNEFDLCGIIQGGSPIDEYDCLTNHILSSFYNKKPRLEIRGLIIHDLEHHFGTLDQSKIDEPSMTELYRTLDTLLDRVEKELYISHENKSK